MSGLGLSGGGFIPVVRTDSRDPGIIRALGNAANVSTLVGLTAHQSDWALGQSTALVGHAEGAGHLVHGNYNETVTFDGATGTQANRATLSALESGDDLAAYKASRGPAPEPVVVQGTNAPVQNAPAQNAPQTQTNIPEQQTALFIDAMKQANQAAPNSPEQKKALAVAYGALDSMRDKDGTFHLSHKTFGDRRSHLNFDSSDDHKSAQQLMGDLSNGLQQLHVGRAVNPNAIGAEIQFIESKKGSANVAIGPNPEENLTQNPTTKDQTTTDKQASTSKPAVNDPSQTTTQDPHQRTDTMEKPAFVSTLPAANEQIAKYVHTFDKQGHVLDKETPADFPKLSVTQVKALQGMMGLEQDGKPGMKFVAALKAHAGEVGIANLKDIDFTTANNEAVAKLATKLKALDGTHHDEQIAKDAKPVEKHDQQAKLEQQYTKQIGDKVVIGESAERHNFLAATAAALGFEKGQSDTQIIDSLEKLAVKNGVANIVNDQKLTVAEMKQIASMAPAIESGIKSKGHDDQAAQFDDSLKALLAKEDIKLNGVKTDGQNVNPGETNAVLTNSAKVRESSTGKGA